jgi:hypothetical protein
MSTPQSAPSPQRRPLQVFLCHSALDKTYVRNLCKKLRAEGFDPWLDEERLLGLPWAREIPKAVLASDVVIVLLSRRGVGRMRYWTNESGLAIRTAQKMPTGAVLIIPALMEKNVKVPRRLQQYSRVELFQPGSYEQLLSTLRQRAQSPRRQRDHQPVHMPGARRPGRGRQGASKASPNSLAPEGKLSFLKKWFRW